MAAVNADLRVSRSPGDLMPPAEEVSTADLAQMQQDAEVTFQAQNTIEVGPDSASDPGYQTDDETRASRSLASSVRDYTFENGRRYHKFREGAYAMPNDEAEQDREDMKHAMVVNLCGGRLHFAPIEDPQNIIDLGTGTGIWAIDMGDDYPSASILGIDLSPIQPAWVPGNVRFMVDDAESIWLHPPDHFDFVHARFCLPAFKDFPTLIACSYKHLKPGAWVELQDLDFAVLCDDKSLNEEKYQPIIRWLGLIDEGFAKLGFELNGSRKHAQRLSNAGFINVEERVFKVPIGPWPKNRTLKLVGLYMRSILYDGLDGISLGALARGMGWTLEEVEAVLVDVQRAILNNSQHTYFTFHAVYGQKPFK